MSILYWCVFALYLFLLLFDFINLTTFTNAAAISQCQSSPFKDTTVRSRGQKRQAKTQHNYVFLDNNDLKYMNDIAVYNRTNDTDLRPRIHSGGLSFDWKPKIVNERISDDYNYVNDLDYYSKLLSELDGNQTLRNHDELNKIFNELRRYNLTQALLAANYTDEDSLEFLREAFLHKKHTKISDDIMKEFLSKHNLFMDKKPSDTNKTNPIQITRNQQPPTKVNITSVFTDQGANYVKSLVSGISSVVNNIINNKDNLQYFQMPHNEDQLVFGLNNVIRCDNMSTPLKIRRGTCQAREKTVKDIWSEWSDWSSCSVSCGRGRSIRWKTCLEPSQCPAQYTIQQVPCALPDCSPFKLFGIIK